ncbi:MAG: M1 family metallopeptidase [Candidatus Hodarchaeales archaeon]
MRISIEGTFYLIIITVILGLFTITPSYSFHDNMVINCDTSSCNQFNNIPAIPPSREELSSYRIAVEFFPLDHRVTGWINVSFLNTENIILDDIFFHIWGSDSIYNAVTIHDIVDSSNNPLEYSIREFVNLNVSIPGGVLPEQRYQVNIRFSVEFLYENEDRFGYVTDPHVVHAFGNWHPVISVFENGSWNQNPYAYSGEAFYSELAYYNVTIVAPEEEVIAAGGDLQSATVDSGKKIWHWTAGPIRDFTWVSSPDYQISSLDHEGITIYSYYFPEHQLRGEIALNITKNSVDLFSELYDPWQYKTMVVVELMAWFGGMEYCQLVMITHGFYNNNTALESFESVLSHEWSHNWNTYIVGNNPWQEPWLDEGWAMYSSVLYAERYHGKEKAKEIISYHKQNFVNYLENNADLPLVTGMDYWESNSDYGYGIYIKGELVIDLLRYVMGDEAFFSSVQAFYDEFAYKTGVTNGDHLRVFEETSGMELTWFFDQFVYNSGIPKYNISLAEFYFDYPTQEYLTRITIEQDSPYTPFVMILPVTIEFNLGPNKHYVYIINGSNLEIELNLSPAGFKPVKIIVDQEWVLIRDSTPISKDFSEVYSISTSTSTSVSTSERSTTTSQATSPPNGTGDISTSSINVIPLLLAVLPLYMRKHER